MSNEIASFPGSRPASKLYRERERKRVRAGEIERKELNEQDVERECRNYKFSLMSLDRRRMEENR